MKIWKLNIVRFVCGLAAERPTVSHVCALALVLLCPVLGEARDGLIPPFPASSNAPIQTWSFSDTNTCTSDRGHAPIAFTNLDWSPLGDGPAVVVDSSNTALLQYEVTESNGSTNLTVDTGSLIMWFAPNWTSADQGGTGPGAYGRLIEAGSYTDEASYGWWSLYFDPGGTNIYFSAQDDSGCTATYLSAPISWDITNRWHQIALTYSPTGSCSLYLNGVLATNAPAMTCWPGSNALSHGFCIGSDTNGLTQAHGMFDSVAAYNYPLTPKAVSATFGFSLADYLLNPMNRANISSAPSTPVFTPTFEAITGAGYLTNLGSLSGCATNSRVWITNVVVTPTTNGMVDLKFAIAGGSPGLLYDAFATTALQYPLSDGIWAWMGQGPSCSTYRITNLGNSSVFLVLGTPQDTDQDGLTDAYELLVSHTDPNNPDTAGIGISDGWQVVFGNDPYIPSPSGDGFLLVDEYRNNANPFLPTQFAPPRGLVATLNQATWTATLSWQAAIGVVTGYTVWLRDSYALIHVGVTNTFVDTSYPPITNFLAGHRNYGVQANYAGGDSPWVYIDPWKPGPSVTSLRGSNGAPVFFVKQIPAGATALRFMRLDWDGQDPTQYSITTNADFPASLFTNGFVTLPFPSRWTDSVGSSGDAYCIQPVWPDGSTNPAISVGSAPIVFYDGRAQLKHNADLMLRAARDQEFAFGVWDTYSQYWIDSPTNYAYAGLYKIWDYVQNPYSFLDEFQPFEDNALYRNMVFTNSEVDSGGFLTNGVVYFTEPVFVLPTTYAFYQPDNPGQITTPADLLSQGQNQWLYNRPPDSSDTDGMAMICLSSDGHGGMTMSSGCKNFFGLPYISSELAYAGSTSAQFATINAGGSVASAPQGYWYAATAPPACSTLGYYFCEPTRSYLSGDPLPGQDTFAVTNTSPLLIGSVGQSLALAGYAKQAVTNANPGVFMFLGQYFDQAFKIGANGAATTANTGILSPYGEFFPTEPGSTALVTMTNFGVNERGTAVVQVVSLNVDANRDGFMDFTFTGPDQTTQDQPLRFWVNDNHDWLEDGGDGVPQKRLSDQDANLGITYAGGDLYKVQGVRDLIDFFPVYINIRGLFQTNAYGPTISPSDSNYHFKLSQADGALRFAYTSLTATNFMDYLLDTNVARSLASAELATITSTGVDLTISFLNQIASNGQGIILVEAARATSKPLRLDISQGTNWLGSTQLYLSTSTVEQMFRHKNLVHETFPNPNSLGDNSDRLSDSDVPNEPDTNARNFVFLHGYNVNPDESRGAFADVFKRLYWSGSRARFYGVTWKGSQTQGTLKIAGVSVPGITPNFHTNVVNALLTAPHLAGFLTTLTNGPTIAVAHSLGNMVVLSALSDSNAPISKFFMLDAAVPIEAIQGNAPQTVDMIYSDWIDYAGRLYSHEWHTLFMPSDFRSGLTWTNRLGNFHNTDVYNFYSSGEEVLRDYTGDPPPGFLSSLPGTIWQAIQQASGSWVWVWQEKGKGRGSLDGFMASTHGGWKFNYHPPYLYTTNGLPAFMTPAQATTAAVPDPQLQTNAFFDLTSPSFGSADTALYGSGGNAYAQTNRDRLLSDAIPAMTLPVGANPVPRLVPLSRNFDLQANYENGWPSSRGAVAVGAQAAGEWHHSDFRVPAYTFTHKLFDDFVKFGQLQ